MPVLRLVKDARGRSDGSTTILSLRIPLNRNKVYNGMFLILLKLLDIRQPISNDSKEIKSKNGTP
jgi:hypothetical protein